MTYHPIIGILIFFITVIISFFLGKNAFRKYKNKENTKNLGVVEFKSKTSYNNPPKGDITSPDAPWIKD